MKEDQSPGQSPDPNPNSISAALTSPLNEVDPDSLSLLFDRINDKLVQGLPELITEDDLIPVATALRNARKYFLQEQDRLGRAPPKVRAGAKKGVKAGDIKNEISAAMLAALPNLDDL